MNHGVHWLRARAFLGATVATVLLGTICALPASGQDPVGPEFQVSTYTSGSGYSPAYPSVTADGNGGFIIVWGDEGGDGSYGSVLGQRYDSAGLMQGGEFQVNTYTTGNQYYPSVAAHSDGSFVVVWSSAYDQDGNSSGVFGQRYDSAGVALGAEFQVNTYTTDAQFSADVSVDDNGGFVVIWLSLLQDGDSAGVFGRRFNSVGAAGSEFQVNSYTTGLQRYPSLAVSDADNFVVVWQGPGDGSDPGIFGRRFNSAGAVGSDFQINAFTSGFQGTPSVAADSNGGFVVVWASYDSAGPSSGVFVRRYDSMGNSPAGEFQVDNAVGYFQGYPDVATDANDGFAVVWTSYDYYGSAYDVIGQRFSSDGSATGSEFQINTFTTGYQRYPAVAANNDGGFVVAWGSVYQVGTGENVFGQRFAPPVDNACHLKVEKFCSIKGQKLAPAKECSFLDKSRKKKGKKKKHSKKKRGKDTKYTYLIANTGTVTAFDISVIDDDLGELRGSPIGELTAGEEIALSEKKRVIQSVTNTVFVSATNVVGDRCGAEASATVTVTRPLCANGKPFALVFAYTEGAACPGANTQNKDSCSGETGAGIVAVSVDDPAKVSADYVVIGDGDFITFRSTGSKLPAALKVKIGGQSLNIHTSCSNDLIIGQSFGSLTLTGFIYP